MVILMVFLKPHVTLHTFFLHKKDFLKKSLFILLALNHDGFLPTPASMQFVSQWFSCFGRAELEYWNGKII